MAFFLLLILGLLMLGGFVLRVLLAGIFLPWTRPFRQRREQRQTRPEGSVNIDYVPPRQDLKDSRPGNNVPDSEYVDYEEVKDSKKP